MFNKILLELRFLTLTHFSLLSQLLLHCLVDLNETWRECCTTSVDLHVGR